MVEVSYDKLRDIAKQKGYKWFTATYDLNVIGIRSNNTTPDSFDDTLAIAYIDSGKNKRVFTCPLTCDPGLYYLKHPLDSKGCAIIPLGQYLGIWELGKHKGYTALVQRKAIKVLRDNDKNSVLGGQLQTIEELGGFNLHRSIEDGIAYTVGKFSAGCQTVQVAQDFDYVISLVRLQIKFIKSSIVSYTLISEKDIN